MFLFWTWSSTFTNGIWSVSAKVVLAVLGTLDHAIIVLLLPSTSASSFYGSTIGWACFVLCVHVCDKNPTISANQVVLQVWPGVFIATASLYSFWISKKFSLLVNWLLIFYYHHLISTCIFSCSCCGSCRCSCSGCGCCRGSSSRGCRCQSFKDFQFYWVSQNTTSFEN